MTRTFPTAPAFPFLASLATFAACVPAGNSTPSDAGPNEAAATPTVRQAPNVMTSVFEDNFDRAPGVPSAPPAEHPGGDGGADGLAPSPSSSVATAAPSTSEAGEAVAPTGYASNGGLGPDWHQAGTSVWHIESGRLCGQGAKNHGVWLRRILPINARIEFDAISDSPDGDLKTEAWGDGQSSATSISYTNATSYLAILGGWKNTYHVLARINEHGTDRKEIKIDPTSDDPREKPVTRGQSYHFKIERRDGKSVHWSVDGVEYLSYVDNQPLAGLGHDHFGFNDWEVKVCFDNVKVTPL